METPRNKQFIKFYTAHSVVRSMMKSCRNALRMCTVASCCVSLLYTLLSGQSLGGCPG